MRELLIQVCRGLGIDESGLSIEETQAEGESGVNVILPLSSVQTLDGREHRTAKALRLLLSAAAAAKGTKLNVVVRAQE